MNTSTFSKIWRDQFQLKSIFSGIAIILGIVEIWRNRFLIWVDGVSYLDIADAYLNADWSSAINACWSPLYSWVLGIALFVFKPSSYWELPVVKGINFIVYLLTLVSFNFFLDQLIIYSSLIAKQKDSQDNILEKPNWVWISLGYTIFIWSSIEWIIVYRDAPDMMVAGLIYLASAMVLRIAVEPIAWSNYLILGILLGFGYLAKSFLLPLGFIFLISSIHVGNHLNFKRALLRVAISALVMLLIAAPFITAISLQKGRLTFGDAGKLNYAWYISPKAPDHFWLGWPPGSGIPVHPTRKIHDNPEIQEFATPVSGSYPPWYDPSYWNEGLRPTFNLSRQLICIAKNLFFSWKLFLGFLVFACLILASISKRGLLGLFNGLMLNWRVLLPSVAGLCSFIMFTEIHRINEPWVMIQTRYIAPFIVILFMGVFLSADLINSKAIRRLLTNLTLATVVVTNINLALLPTRLQLTPANIAPGSEHVHWQIANELNRLGIQAGDKVAIFGIDDFYWARLAKVKIVASPSSKFWLSDERQKSAALKVLEKLGIKALVLPPYPAWRPYYSDPKQAYTYPSNPSDDWKKLGSTNGYAYLFKQ